MSEKSSLVQWFSALGSASSKKRKRADDALRHLVGPTFGSDDLEQREERAVARFNIEKALAESTGVAGRAGRRWLEEEIERQSNRESVADFAAEMLNEVEDEGADGADKLNPDWLNVFTAHAEKASSESLRTMWARVLSGEIRKPGAVSLRTLQFASTLDLPTAKAMQSMASWVYNEKQLPHIATSHLPFDTIQLLKDEGLIGSMDADVTSNVTLFDGWWPALFGPVAVFVKGQAGQVVSISSISVSRVARELLATISVVRDPAAPIAFAESLKNHGSINAIRVGPYVQTAEGQLNMPSPSLMDWKRPAVIF